MNKTDLTWNFSPLFSSDTDPKIEIEKQLVEQKVTEFVQKWKNRDDYLTDPATLAIALNEYNEWQEKYGISGKMGYYFDLRSSQDQLDTDLKAKENLANEFAIKMHNLIQFFELNIAKIPQDKHQQFLNHQDLQKYKHFLFRLFSNSRYLLTEPEEKILALKSQTALANWVKMTAAFISKEERELKTDEGVRKASFEELLKQASYNKNETTRDEATSILNQIFEKHSDVAEYELNSVLQDKKINDELRGRERPDLSRHIADDIESEVVDSLLNSVSSKNTIPARFYELKSKLLGKTILKYNERNLEYGNIDQKYTFEESIDLIKKVFTALDPEFSQILTQFLDNGQFDVFPRKGKRGGAFCAGNLITHPTYILLNHTDKLNDVLTIAHEMGHGINNELIKQKQIALYYDTPTSTAEVASTFMEDFVLQELRTRADDETRLALMIMKLNDDVSSIFRQVACYKFEQDIHNEFRKKGYISKEEIGNLFQKNMTAYMGEYVEQPAWAKNWWIYWSHIRSYFYVYSYAGGLLISKSLQNFVKNDPAFIQQVKQFLSSGTSDSPKNIFAKMDIDITDKNFWNKGLAEIEKLLEETTELAKKLGKI